MVSTDKYCTDKMWPHPSSLCKVLHKVISKSILQITKYPKSTLKNTKKCYFVFTKHCIFCKTLLIKYHISRALSYNVLVNVVP